MTLQLYCFGESGNAYKVALALEMTGLAWEPVHLDFFGGAARTPDYRETVNAMSEAPVLIDRETGLHLTQSGVMLDWIAETTGKLGAATPEERREIWRWLLWDNHKLSGQIGTCRFLMHFLPPEKRPAEVIAFLQGRLKAAYRVLDGQLAGRDWIAADRPTIADLSCCGYLYYPEPFGFDRADWPAIAAWMDRVSDLPGWKPPYDLMARAFPPAAA